MPSGSSKFVGAGRVRAMLAVGNMKQSKKILRTPDRIHDLSGADANGRGVMDDPEISFGSGPTQVVLKGREAIHAVGWTLPFLLFARGIVALVVAISVAVCVIMRWWLMLS
jgi:hypothetical protein